MVMMTTSTMMMMTTATMRMMLIMLMAMTTTTMMMIIIVMTMMMLMMMMTTTTTITMIRGVQYVYCMMRKCIIVKIGEANETQIKSKRSIEQRIYKFRGIRGFKNLLEIGGISNLRYW